MIAEDYKFIDVKIRANGHNCWGGSVSGMDRTGKQHTITCDVEMYSPLAACRYLLAKLEHLWYVHNNPGSEDTSLDPDLDPPEGEEEEDEDYDDLD